MVDEKRKVYNGYEEKYMIGEEIHEYFKDCYECFGRHHEKTSSYKINLKKYYPRIKLNIKYRVFLNDLFCIIMNADTDAKIYFFGYTKNKPVWAKD